MPRLVDHAGRTYGRLLVLSQAENLNNQTRWHCRCECGTKLALRTINFVSGNTKSCGCWKSETTSMRVRARCTTHGASVRGNKKRSYIIWMNMVQRCTNPLVPSYIHYGARGISMCDRWRTSYANFIADMGDPPVGYSIDRINNDGNYEPTNCRWAPRKVQARNTRRNHMIEYLGERLALSEWAERTGLPYATLLHRVTAGWSPEEALTRKVDQRYSPIARAARCAS